MLGGCTAANQQGISPLDYIFVYVQEAPSPNQVEDSSNIKIVHPRGSSSPKAVFLFALNRGANESVFASH